MIFFGKPVSTFPDHALARKRKSGPAKPFFPVAGAGVELLAAVARVL
jgi:hypothetical protein